MWITRDYGAHWKNVTPPELTPWSKVSQIDASRVDDDTAFVAVNRFRLDDLRPYVYITHDGGAHWQLRVDGLSNEPVNAVRQDPVAPRLLYAATENGVYVSFDAGAHWQPLQQNLPKLLASASGRQSRRSASPAQLGPASPLLSPVQPVLSAY